MRRTYDGAPDFSDAISSRAFHGSWPYPWIISGAYQNLVGRAGSGLEVLEIPRVGSGRVGSGRVGGFQISRVWTGYPDETRPVKTP